jgi:hypothetical protein
MRVIGRGFAHLSGLTALQQLKLREYESVTDSGVAHLSGLTALQHLYVDEFSETSASSN